MSRGLSQQQRLILGLAVAMSRHHYGTPKAHAPIIDKAYRIPVAFSATLPDVTLHLAMHLVHGVPLQYVKTYTMRAKPVTTYGVGPMQLTPHAKSRKNSASRAIQTLMRHGMLVYRPRRTGEDHRSAQWYGYLLTAAGLEAGARHEIALPHDVDLRLAVLGWRTVIDRLGLLDAWHTKIGAPAWHNPSVPRTFTHPCLLTVGYPQSLRVANAYATDSITVGAVPIGNRATTYTEAAT